MPESCTRASRNITAIYGVKRDGFLEGFGLTAIVRKASRSKVEIIELSTGATFG